MSDADGLTEEARQLLEQNVAERERIEAEIQELKERNEKRKKEREVEEKRLIEQRAADESRRKAEEDERRKVKEAEDQRKQRERARKTAECEKLKSPVTSNRPNFVIAKKADDEKENGTDKKAEKKTRQQLEEEKASVLKQRVKPLAIDGASMGQLADKAKSLHAAIASLEGEKYDLERSCKLKQVELMNLAERARQATKIGKASGNVKRSQVNSEEDLDKVQGRFTSAPSKVVVANKYERKKDSRSYGDRKNVFAGPQYGSGPERIQPKKVVQWSEEGLPIYSEPGSATNGVATNGQEE